MPAISTKSQRVLEIFIVVIAVALTCLLHKMAGYKMVVLNLFYLPVILSAFFLGRYRASVLALLCVMTVSVVTALHLSEFAPLTSPIVIGLSIAVWGAVLGLTAILVGTLSDELSAKMHELHEAHVGVVEVLSKYLQSANQKLKDRSLRIAELSQQVAMQMKLSAREVDDIRVAALLLDMENIEITAKVIQKAVGDLEDDQRISQQHTFPGTDLVQSLSSVLAGAFPLLLNQNGTGQFTQITSETSQPTEVPFGARIIQTVRAYDGLVSGDWSLVNDNAAEAIDELRSADHHPVVLDALERILREIGTAEQVAAKERTTATVPVESGA